MSNWDNADKINETNDDNPKTKSPGSATTKSYEQIQREKANRQQVKLSCLSLANSAVATGADAEGVVARAKAYYAFVGR